MRVQMSIRRRHAHAQFTLDSVDLVSLSILLVALVAVALGLIGVALRGTTPLVVIPPLLLGCWGIATLRK